MVSLRRLTKRIDRGGRCLLVFVRMGKKLNSLRELGPKSDDGP
jgi:hypothetical protein